MLSDRGRFICTLEDRGRLVQHMALGLGRLDCPSVGVQDAKSTPEMSPRLIKSEEDCVCVRETERESVCMLASMSVCMCMCVSCMSMCLWIYMCPECVCPECLSSMSMCIFDYSRACVCVCERVGGGGWCGLELKALREAVV